MTTKIDITRLRLHHQHLAGPGLESPAAVVDWLGAVQSQDYAGAKWAVAMRAGFLTEAALEQAFNQGSILRTHLLRPTWHFVTPADIRWLLKLTAPRVNALNKHYYRRLELDEALFERSKAVLARALEGGQQRTRSELATVLQQAGIECSDLMRLSYIMMEAELDGLVCSGALQDKQHTYALLEERVPVVRPLEQDEALAELAWRYFSSHGPATLPDFIWWAGLSAVAARAGLALVKSRLEACELNGQTYYWQAAGSPQAGRSATPAVQLLPNYDEYVVGYTDRAAIFDQSYLSKLDSRGNPLFNHTIIINGQIEGIWKRVAGRDGVKIEATFFTPVPPETAPAVQAAVQNYGRYLQLPVSL